MTNQKLKILIVDDFGMMRKIVKKTLTGLGYSYIAEAPNGELALEKLRSEHFDLIISDWNMPVMTGVAFLQAVRGNPKLSDIPFIMLTAEATLDQITEAIKSGVTQYIIKPFTPEILKAKIDLALKPHK
ncbi:MAG: response regulator [Deltaproteobacteria bacterium]|nr:response regulator [Deltaproteobacteria bacterium]